MPRYYKEYVNESEIVDKDFVLEMFSSDRKSAVEQFKKYMNKPSEDKCLEDEEKIRLTDNEVRACLGELGIASISDLQQKEKGKRDEIIRAVKSMKGISIRQLSGITGLPKNIVPILCKYIVFGTIIIMKCIGAMDMKIGYARVSTQDQNLDNQIDQLKADVHTSIITYFLNFCVSPYGSVISGLIIYFGHSKYNKAWRCRNGLYNNKGSLSKMGYYR